MLDAKVFASAALMTDYTQILRTMPIPSLPAGMKLDLGAIAKGWAAEEIARELEAQGGPSFFSILAETLRRWRKNDDTPWIAGIDDPFNTRAVVYASPVITGIGYQRSYQRYSR